MPARCAVNGYSSVDQGSDFVFEVMKHCFFTIPSTPVVVVVSIVSWIFFSITGTVAAWGGGGRPLVRAFQNFKGILLSGLSVWWNYILGRKAPDEFGLEVTKTTTQVVDVPAEGGGAGAPVASAVGAAEPQLQDESAPVVGVTATATDTDTVPSTDTKALHAALGVGEEGSVEEAVAAASAPAPVPELQDERVPVADVTATATDPVPSTDTKALHAALSVGGGGAEAHTKVSIIPHSPLNYPTKPGWRNW